MNSDVFEFTDYRCFLNAHALMMKKKTSGWSYGRWAKQLRLKGTASLSMILNGQRDPGPTVSVALIKYFKFDAGQRQYFLDLIRLHKIRDDSRLRVLLMQELGRQHPSGEFKILDERAFEAVSQWQHYAIREMVRLECFKEDAEWICKKLRYKLTPTLVKRAIETLLSVKLLRRDTVGRLDQDSGRVTTTNDVATESLKMFHEQMLDHAKESVRQTPVAERDLSGSTFTIDVKDLAEMKAYLRGVRATFVRQFERKSGNATYQFETAFFPLTYGGNENDET